MASMPPVLSDRPAHLKSALVLGAAAIVATLALFPYVTALMPHKFAALPQPLWLVALLQALQAGVLCWLLGWLGLFLGARHGLGAPWLAAWLARRPTAALKHHWGLAVLCGVLAALLIVGLDRLRAHPGQVATMASASVVIHGWAWRGALASFYGGIVEEVECRLFLLSLLVWLLVWLLARLPRQAARPWMFVLAIVLAALLFGAGHLPAAFAAGLAGTPLLIARIIVLNAVAGVVFGAVYWRWGLEHAMLAHFSADLVLHVALPLLRLG
jgi:membrane protease YdiL (CAAX protease family)